MSKVSNFVKENISILIVEDETVLAIGMEYSLQNMGYNISGIESSAQNAINHVRQNRPDIIIMDINLKGDVSGTTAAKQIWQYYKVPIIFLTSYSDEKTIKKAIECEPYGYLLKPCKDDELNIAIQVAIYKHNYFFKNIKTFNKTDNLIKLTNKVDFHKGKSLLYYENNPIKLTGNETKLFEILCENIGETVSFERISSYIWRDGFYDLGKLRTLIYRVKQKTKEDLIQSVFEVGYKIEEF
ncbi:signal transduction protein [Arcobacter sp. CECT 8986]|uniref:response regulator n=1 Tax=Arcobacter sp. CECT 8986 TaxID=2044507 RepID=UPI001009BEC9|nr:response regulator [Arcobacter sp. CECT 8986]RXK00239.1 signal transduction protein [Arcobacter sp. CECT 8986]